MSLADEYKRLAATGQQFRGLSCLQHAEQIGELIKATGSKTLLDWGCGGGDQYRKPHQLQKRWGVDRPRLYDPHFPRYSGKPIGRFHGVICTDVLEHLRETAVDAFIAGLFNHAERFVFASVCCRPAKKVFSNGENMHLTIQPYDWWHAKFEVAEAGQAARPIVRWQLVETA